MISNIHILRLLSLVTFVALGCASTSTPTAKTNPSSPAENVMKSPQEVTLQPEVTMQPDAAPSLEPVYFETDQWVLRNDARTSLKVRAAAIQQHPEWGVVTIQGHCDERGTDEYNIALGDRRATAVKRYLMDLGVPASRLATVTYGEDRPAVPGHDEAAWRLNRRTEFASDALQSARR